MQEADIVCSRRKHACHVDLYAALFMRFRDETRKGEGTKSNRGRLLETSQKTILDKCGAIYFPGKGCC